MGYLIASAVFFFVGWKLGRKYQDFQDIMLAKRIAKMIDQRNTLEKEREAYARYERLDEKYGKTMKGDLAND